MASSGGVGREALSAAFDAIEAALDKAVAVDCDALTTRDLLDMLERCERVRRRIPAIEHPLINNLGRQPRVNTFHHPEKLLRDGDDEGEP